MNPKTVRFSLSRSYHFLNPDQHSDLNQGQGGICAGNGMIDWGRVKDLRSEIGAEDFSDVVALFLEEADEVIARISANAGAKGLESDLHFLKGAALNLGFDALATVCQDGERRRRRAMWLSIWIGCGRSIPSQRPVLTPDWTGLRGLDQKFRQNLVIGDVAIGEGCGVKLREKEGKIRGVLRLDPDQD